MKRISKGASAPTLPLLYPIHSITPPTQAPEISCSRWALLSAEHFPEGSKRVQYFKGANPDSGFKIKK